MFLCSAVKKVLTFHQFICSVLPFTYLMTWCFQNVSQEFISAEVLKLYGLTKDHSQKTDWQKMLKFGKKKRDRVDHILVGPKAKCLIYLV